MQDTASQLTYYGLAQLHSGVHPNPQSRNPKPEIRDLRPETRNPRRGTRDTKPDTPKNNAETLNPSLAGEARGGVRVLPAQPLVHSRVQRVALQCSRSTVHAFF